MLVLSEYLMGSALIHRARALVRQRSSVERPIQASLGRCRAQWAVGALHECWNQNATGMVDRGASREERREAGGVWRKCPVLRRTRVKKANATARLNLTCTSKEIHHDDLESSAI